MAKQSNGQKKTVARVMHEYKHGELETRAGDKVKSPRQAVAIGLSEAGASNEQSSGQNKHALSRTKAKERHGETAQQEKEGRTAIDRRKPARRASRSGSEASRAELYEQAKRRGVAGRSHMSKAELQHALGQ